MRAGSGSILAGQTVWVRDSANHQGPGYVVVYGTSSKDVVLISDFQ